MREHKAGSLPGRHARLSAMSVVAKLSLVIGGATLVVLGAFGVIVGNSTTATLREDAVRDLKSKVDIVVNMMERSDENMRAKADETAKVFAARFAEPFSLVSDRRVPVVNVDTPALYSGRTLLNGNLGLVDDFSRDTGAIATIFARQGDDFVRVATSLRKQDGSRAMGTVLGKTHPAYEAAMQGGRFVGHAQLFGKPYMSVYSPVRDGKGEVIAILYIGTDLTGEIRAIKTSIREIRIGDTGYFFALSTLKGPDYGQMAVHPTLEGKPQDLATQPVLREMLEKRNGILEYSTDLDGVVRDKLSVYREAKGWDWIVAAGAYADEAFKVSNQVRNNLLVATVVVIAILIIAIFFISRRLFLRPVNSAAEAVRAIAAGDLSRQIEAGTGDEMGQLLFAMKQMQEVLLRVLENVKEVVSAAARGDFSRRVDETGMRGFQLEIARDVNTLVATSEEGLGDVSRVLSALAQGDLTQSMDKEYQGLFGKLKEDANKTAAQLGEIVVRIKDSADTINVASKEIASGNADLSQRTEEQASSLEETASSMEELTSTVKQNAENARQANHLAIGASEIATRGGKVVGEVVSTMEGISESSRKIADIIGVIDGIAFQTNILALNAAVEAARAGEQGRGFAVVATEVRNLAQRSAAAAKEIKTLIGDSVGKVEAGSRQVGEAGKTMNEILVSVKRVTDIMAEITAASAEQSSGIEQVSMAVAQMDEVTQQNAALVEQAAAAAESLRDEAAKLVQSTLTFKLEDQGEYLERVRSAVADLIRQFPSGIESDPRSATIRNGSKLPGLRSGGRTISGDETVVDGLLERLGVVATIFACEGGEFVRVSTSIRGENGDRVLGTRLDRSHPAFVCLNDKNPYEGSMVLFGQAYMTRYVPIVDPRGSVIGAFFVGAEMSASGHARGRRTGSAQNHADSPARIRPRPKNIVRLDPSAKTASKQKARARSSGATAALADDQWQEF